MKHVILAVLGSVLVFSATSAVASPADEASTLYLEVKRQTYVFLPQDLGAGIRALVPAMALPEESIIAIDMQLLERTVELDKNEPHRIRYPFVPPGKSQAVTPARGWVCGARIVDINDEDLRELEDADRTDFCFSISKLSELEALESNHEATIASFKQFQKKGDSGLLSALVQRIRDIRFNEPTVDLVTATALISPLKDCSVGCLKATSEFGPRRHPVLKRKRMHKGIDLRAADGTEVVSVLPGKVLAIRTEKRGKKIKGYGHYIIVVHPAAKLETKYAHLSQFKVKNGSKLDQGQLIALSGSSGIGTGPHLHFETLVPGGKGYAPTNPRRFLAGLLDSVAAFFNFLSVKA
ncbi:M23 family metallopeptidase [Bdellovibrio reynosensis]|uniref:M23 family metallopeptidase n=1 Tax=Bdellovibrio reynosensis TaxID=2835041 RepID=A0ABY4CCJ1_9BACT|nr:M23 family metallopeptidase [Bdellovibrio reynosensis]UOF02667.1 M23 family metallopeptidase [Bdellovibrio reynosensis]